MSTFEDYLQEFHALTAQIQQTLTQNVHQDNASIQSLFAQCDDILKQLSIEARSVEHDEELKQQWLATVKMTKSQLAALKQDYKHKLSTAERASLFSGKEQLYQNEEMAQRQADSLERARQTMAETEQVGAEITSELSRNRETLERTSASVTTFSSMTDKAASIIKTMSRRRGIKD
jgi:ElaB/YqjD/DUF883 family membrane-anchored ribosome-binding protein